MLLNISLGLLIAFVFSTLVFHPKLQPTLFALYGLTSLFMAFFIESQIFPYEIIIEAVYFMRSISSVIVPFVLLALVYLIYQRIIKNPSITRNRKFFSYFIIGTILIFIALTFWEVYRQSPAADTLTKVYALLAFYFFMLLFTYILMNVMIDLWSRKKDARTIIVLGSQLEEIGEISNLLQRRLDKAAKLYHRQYKKTQQRVTIIVTGGARETGEFTEAEKMAEYLIETGIAKEDIIKENQARNTYENFLASKLLIAQYHLDTPPLVVTSRFHLVRSEYIARQANLVAYFEGSNSPIYSWYFSILREFFAYLLLTKEINFVFMMLLIIQGIIHYFA